MSGTVLFEAQSISDSMNKLAEKISVDFSDPSKLVIVGIQTRGVELSRRLCDIFEKRTGKKNQVGFIDVSFHRDDLTTRGKLPELKETSLDFDINEKDILLVDDVLFTGRTTKAAMETLMSFGRPSSIRLSVLVDRGGRELPIQPDYCCYKVDTSESDSVRVILSDTDGAEDSVLLIKGQ